MAPQNNSVGTVQTKFANFKKPFKLQSGETLPELTVAYETYGTLNESKSNAILITHALSGDAHAAGFHKGDKKPGWWDEFIGPGKGLDTNKYFIICSNFLGGCKGTTGPKSTNPKTGLPYSLEFPLITVSDMVRVQKLLLDHLKIKKLLAIVGGSLGGMQALEWSVKYPKAAHSILALATTAKSSPQTIAFNEVGRQAIMSDPAFANGNYYFRTKKPKTGLAIARMIGHITYLSDKGLQKKFGRKLQDKNKPDFSFNTEFQIESYLKYKGGTFVDRFDANSYLYITRAMDYFDVARGKSLSIAFAKTQARFLVVSFTSDWLYPPEESQKITHALTLAGKNVTYYNITADYGHDSFLVKTNELARIVRRFLDSSYKEFEKELKELNK